MKLTMANSLLKWCKTKIFNGYKHINVEATDEMASGNRSDTEYLVRSSEEEFLLTPSAHGYSCSPAVPSPNEISYSMTTSPKVSIERRKRPLGWRSKQGVDCDLRLTEDGCEKREFAFTLYDFHGQGKVTRDDIASLVQSIYETVGSSLSLPPSGSRTVRVKLSVAPAERKHRGHDNRGQRGSSWICSSPKESPRTLCNDSYVTPVESPRFCEEWSATQSVTASPNGTSVQNESPRTGDSMDSLSPRQDCPFDLATPRYSSLGGLPSPRLGEGPATPGRSFEAEEAESLIEEITPRRGRRKKNRKVHYQRQELLQMIKASMEKNNLFYPPLRSTFCHHPHHHSHHHRRRKRPQQHHQHCGCCCRCCCGGGPQKCGCSGGPPVDPAMLKARLMHYDTTTSNNNDTITGVDTSTVTTEDSTSMCCERTFSSNSGEPNHHHRSRSQDLNTDSPHVFRHHLLEPPTQQQHPLPPSNTPDRPTSPRLNQHHHSHNHHHFSYRHRSRSCEGEESVKDRWSLLHHQHSHHQPLYHHSKKKTGRDSTPFYPLNLHSKYKAKLDYHRAMNEVVSWMEKSTFKDCDERGSNGGNKNSDDNLVTTSPKTIITTIHGDGSDYSRNKTSKVYGDNDLIVATRNSNDDDASPSPNSTSGCGRSQHVHQHFHHHYHHYPSTPLII